MGKSARLREEDWRDLLNLVGECRELGDDPHGWRSHLLGRLSALADAEVGMAVEGAGCRELAPRDLGVVTTSRASAFDPSAHAEHLAGFRNDPDYAPSMLRYLARMAQQDGVCLSRTGFMEDRDWYPSFDYQVIQKALGADHMLYCFREIPRTEGQESSGLILMRNPGRRDFSPRELAIVREAQAALAPMVGGPLSRFADPSPMSLPPRVRQVLACLLEGDGDKQVAARLRLSVYTVNEYTKILFRHFGVNSRTELLARWIRRGWQSPSTEVG